MRVQVFGFIGYSKNTRFTRRLIGYFRDVLWNQRLVLSSCFLPGVRIKHEYRKTATFTGIMKKAFEMAMSGGYDIAVISGTTRQMRLYKRLGFKPFSTPVGKKGAMYQPMYIDVAAATLLQNTSKIL